MIVIESLPELTKILPETRDGYRFAEIIFPGIYSRFHEETE